MRTLFELILTANAVHNVVHSVAQNVGRKQILGRELSSESAVEGRECRRFDLANTPLVHSKSRILRVQAPNTFLEFGACPARLGFRALEQLHEGCKSPRLKRRLLLYAFGGREGKSFKIAIYTLEEHVIWAAGGYRKANGLIHSR